MTKGIEKAHNRTGAWIAAVVVLGVLLMTTFGLMMYFWMRPNPAAARMEDVYQSNFYQLTTAMNGIEENMAVLSIASSPESQQRIAGRIWRQSGEATACLTMLPVNHNALTETYVLLNRLGDYLYTLSGRLTYGELVSDSDKQNIESLYTETSRLTVKLNALMGEMGEYKFGDHLKPDSTAPIGAALDDCACPSLDYTGEFSAQAETKEYKYVETLNELTAENALKVASSHFPQLAESKVTDQTASAPDCYVYDYRGGLLELTRRGGLIASLTGAGESGDADWESEEALEAALNFVNSAYLEEFSALQIRADGVSVSICLAPKVGEIVYACEAVNVKVDLVSRQIVGVAARPYLSSRAARKEFSPAFTKAQAALNVHPDLADRYLRTSVVRRGSDTQLVYEFSGTVKGRVYVVRVDAMSGKEVEVLRLGEDIV